MSEDPASVISRMRDRLFFEGDDLHRRLTRFWLLLVLSAVIATFGVVGDSTATVIGAMIVAPLMVPILGTVLAVVLPDRTNLLLCFGLVITGAAAVVAIAWLIGLIIPTPVVAATNAQVASRVTPNLVDLAAALATGAVGSIALARDDISDTLPGVAIAISLVPPLAVVGLTLESGAPAQALGAFLLFVANVSAILAMGLLVMTIYRISGTVSPAAATSNKPVHRRRGAIAIVAALVVIAVPLAISSTRISHTRATESDVAALADTWASGHGWHVVNVATRADVVHILASGPLPEPETESLRAALVDGGLGSTTTSIELVPSTAVELTTGN